MEIETPVHPKWMAGPEERAIVDLWSMSQTGMGPGGPLPFAGGTADQPVALMVAFAVVDAAWRKLDPPHPKGGGREG